MDPCSGKAMLEDINAFIVADWKFSSIPITSPVDFISGPRIKSTPSNLLNGKTDSLTLKTFNFLRFRDGIKLVNFSPDITLAAILAIGRPIDFATKGTVLLDLGLTSKVANVSVKAPDRATVPSEQVGDKAEDYPGGDKRPRDHEMTYFAEPRSLAHPTERHWTI